MSWARYDDELSLNHKVGRLRAIGVNGIAALGLHVLANTYARHNGTSGIVEPHIPELLCGRCGPKLAGILEEVGMFDSYEDGWVIHDFHDFHDPNDPDPNRSAADRKREIRDKRAEAGRLGGLAKAAKRPSKPSSKEVAVLQQTPSPVPVPVPVPDSSSATSLREQADAFGNLLKGTFGTVEGAAS